jgi:hypothetical protein
MVFFDDRQACPDGMAIANDGRRIGPEMDGWRGWRKSCV